MGRRGRPPKNMVGNTTTTSKEETDLLHNDDDEEAGDEEDVILEEEEEKEVEQEDEDVILEEEEQEEKEVEQEDEEGEEQAGEDEIWDIIEIIRPKDTTEHTCRMEDCQCKAVSIWANNHKPDDHWPMCEKCQDKEFGGWPDGMNNEDNNDDDGNDNGTGNFHDSGNGNKDPAVEGSKSGTETTTGEAITLSNDANVVVDETMSMKQQQQPKRGRGRPPKKKPTTSDENNNMIAQSPRPADEEQVSIAGSTESHRMQGGAKTIEDTKTVEVSDTQKEVLQVVSEGAPPDQKPKRRGRPPKKKTSDEDCFADQGSEKEAVEVAVEQAMNQQKEINALSLVPPKPRRGRPPKKKPCEEDLPTESSQLSSEEKSHGVNPKVDSYIVEGQETIEEKEVVVGDDLALGQQQDMIDGSALEQKPKRGRGRPPKKKPGDEGAQSPGEEEKAESVDMETAETNQEQSDPTDEKTASQGQAEKEGIEGLSFSQSAKKGAGPADGAIKATKDGEDEGGPDPILDDKTSLKSDDAAGTKTNDGEVEEIEMGLDKGKNKVATSDLEGTPTHDAMQGGEHGGQPSVAMDLEEKDSNMEIDGNGAPADDACPEANGEEEVEEAWDLVMVMSIAAITGGELIKCATDGCTLPAACAYVSNLAPTTKWYTCLDCQEADFGGWPDVSEMPIKSMTPEHAAALISKCTKKKDIAMPAFAQLATQTPGKHGSGNDGSQATITPPPHCGLSAMTDISVPGSKNVAAVSPTPVVVGAVTGKAPAKPSKQAMAMHAKWQEAAVAMGGPDVRIVVSKPDAKKIIYDLLHDNFCPMNITQIYKKLKAIVPQPVLKSCLDEMALDKMDTNFAQSDDEGSEPKKEEPKRSDDPYVGSLCFKAGKTANTCLYYVDYNKAKNGNGLERDERNDLQDRIVKTEEEKTAHETSLNQMTAETTKLLGEPTNEELIVRLEKEEVEVAELKKQLEAARKLKVNEKHKLNVKRRIDHMAAEWRKRRRLCMDFLVCMEENTEGAVSAKQCLKGDGPIEVDSDEAVIKSAVEFAKKKRSRGLGKGGGIRSRGQRTTAAAAKGGIPADETFVAVKLDTQGLVERVHCEEEG